MDSSNCLGLPCANADPKSRVYCDACVATLIENHEALKRRVAAAEADLHKAVLAGEELKADNERLRERCSRIDKDSMQNHRLYHAEVKKNEELRAEVERLQLDNAQFQKLADETEQHEAALEKMHIAAIANRDGEVERLKAALKTIRERVSECDHENEGYPGRCICAPVVEMMADAALEGASGKDSPKNPCHCGRLPDAATDGPWSCGAMFCGPGASSQPEAPTQPQRNIVGGYTHSHTWEDRNDGTWICLDCKAIWGNPPYLEPGESPPASERVYVENLVTAIGGLLRAHCTDAKEGDSP